MSKSKKTNVTKYQKYEMLTVSRKDIKAAEYNPRVISGENEARLKKGIRQHGLVQPIVWNRRTGNVVAGHQRLNQIDALEKRDDYDLMVAVVDVSEDEERILNVQLNNDSLMGDWDIEKLKDLGITDGIDFGDMGFTEADISILFGDDERFADMIGETPEVEKAKADLADIKRDRAAQAAKMKKAQSANFYFTVVCESAAEKTSLLKMMGVDVYEDYVGSYALLRLMQKPLA
jgi:hypothetical protein